MKQQALQTFETWLECDEDNARLEFIGLTVGDEGERAYLHRCPICLRVTRQKQRYPLIQHEPAGGK
jgi:hypothetical protein